MINNTLDLYSTIQEAVTAVRSHVSTSPATTPAVGIILGTGLGGLVHSMQVHHTVDYAQIPHMPVSTVESHAGRLLFGAVNGVEVVVMQGRFHLYEGYTAKQVTFPVRVMKFLGVRTLIV